MHGTIVRSTLALLLGIAVGMLGHQVLFAQPAQGTCGKLQQRDLEGVPGWEVIMFCSESDPGAVTGRHYHPGPEFFYVLDGALTIEPDGQPPFTVKAGENGYTGRKQIHNTKNASSTQPAKVIGVMILEKGQPLFTPVP